MELETTKNFEQRKKDHIEHCLDEQVDVSINSFENIKLIHEALPDLNLADIDISKTLLGKMFSSPIFISSMTAGHMDGKKLNHLFASVCQEKNWLFNVGSQRRQLASGNSFDEWKELKQNYSQVYMCANLGLAQVITSSVEKIEEVISSIDAIGLIIHLNSLQEALQIEGTPSFKGGFEKIKQLSKVLSVPVILKETGCGFSINTLNKLNNSGVSVVDVSGYGGTHWGRVEGLRAKQAGHSVLSEMSQTFSNWGVSTLEGLMSVQHLDLSYKIWASGGIRNGLDVAKCLSMGASAVGMARPFLLHAQKGKNELLNYMNQLEQELKIALFCTGSSQIKELAGKWKWTNKN